MADPDTNSTQPKSMKDAFSPGKTRSSGTLFDPKEFDIYVNKITKETYIFHIKPIPHDIARLEYNKKDHSVTVVKEDGTQLDLGAKIQWLVRPHFVKSREVGIVQTKDGDAVDGFMVPLVIKEK